MILADTSIWIEYLRGRSAQLQGLLDRGDVWMHPYIVAELALGSLHDRRKTLSELDALLEANVARIDEIRRMIEARRLYAKGIGLMDAHLLASCLITPGMKLWTRDARLRAAAQALGIDAGLP